MSGGRGAGLVYWLIFGGGAAVAFGVAAHAAGTALLVPGTGHGRGLQYGLAGLLGVFTVANPIFTAFSHTTSDRYEPATTLGTGGSTRSAGRVVTAQSPWPAVIYLALTGIGLLLSGQLTSAGMNQILALLPAFGCIVLLLQALGGWLWSLVRRWSSARQAARRRPGAPGRDS